VEPAVSAGITGTVTRANGDPLSGVELRATPGETGAPVTARTGADGSYRIVGLDDDQSYAVTARSTGFRFVRTEDGKPTEWLPLELHRVGDTVDFLAVAGFEITLDVRMPNGSQPASAQIMVTRGDVPEGATPETFGWVWTPESSAGSLEAGVWHLRARSLDGNDYRAGPLTLGIERSTTEPFHIQLLGNPEIVVTAQPPEGVKYVRISARILMHETNGGRQPIIIGTTHRSKRANFYASENWTVRAIDVKPGQYTVEILFGDTVVASETVVVTDRNVHVAPVLKPPEIGDYIVVQVFGPDGPLETDVTVRVYRRRDGRNLRSPDDHVLDRGQGEYWISRQDHVFADAEGSFEVQVSTQVYGTRSIHYERSDVHPIRVTFSEPVYLTVEIGGYDKHPSRDRLSVACAMAGTLLASRVSWVAAARRSGEGPIQKLGPLEPGEYVVALIIHSGGRGQELLRKTVAVGAGDNRVTLAAPELHSFTIIQTGGRVLITVRSADDLGRSWTTSAKIGDDGAEVKVDDLPAGEYLLQAAGKGQMRVSVPAVAGTRIQFNPLPFNAYVISLKNALRPDDARAMGVEDGDIVLEMNGSSLADFEKAKQYRDDSYQRDSSTWVLSRRGVRISTTFTRDQLRNSRLTLIPFRTE
jgi:hypothetical protein